MNTKNVFKKAVNLLTLSSFLLWNLAAAVPEGGSVVQGSANISQAGNTTTVNQTSQNAVINWNNFNTTAAETVQFVQPNSSSIALNRITSGAPTSFDGSLLANGHVWILNPAGVVFGSNAKIDVAGLLATTHDITNANFMAGNFQFSAVPGAELSKIINNGLISARDSGIVALVAPGVENNGMIVANFGKVSLSSGSAFVLDMYGDNLINFGTSAPIQNGYVSNTGTIKADGGKVYMTANSAAGVLDNVINMSGTIEAKSVGVNHKGEIVLYSGDAQRKSVSGVTRVSGKLDTSDSTGGSNGGKIETSGGYVDFQEGTIINAGMGGLWLLDPFNVVIVAGSGLVGATSSTGPWPPATPPFPAGQQVTSFSQTGGTSIGADFIAAQLNAGTTVFIQTNTGGGADQGNITVNSPITQLSPVSSLVELRLSANNDVIINAPINFSGGASFVAQSENGATGPNFQTIIAANITTGGYQQYTQDTIISNNNITLTSLNSYISFYKKLDSDSIATPRDLTLTAGNQVAFGAFGGSTGDLVGSNAALQTLTVNGSVVAWSNATSITTNGAQTYSGGPFIVYGTSETFNGSVVSFNGGLLASAQELATLPTIQINGAAVIGSRLGSTTFVGGNKSLGAVTITGATTLNNITESATSSQNYQGAVTLTSATTNTLNATGAITFNSTIDGAGALDINAGTAASFNGVVGGTTPLTSLTVTGPTTVNTTAITTSGAQTYNNAVNISGAPTFRSNTGNIRFNSSITGGSNLVVNAVAGTATFNGDITMTSGSLISITAPSGIFFGSSSPQTLTILWNPGNTGYLFNGPVILQQNLSVTTIFPARQNIIFQSTINSCLGGQCINGVGPFSLTVANGDNNNNSGGASLIFNGAIGGSVPLGGLTTWYQGANTIFNAPVTINGNVSINSEYVASGTNNNSITFAAGANLLATGSVQLVHNGGALGHIGAINLNALLGSISSPLGSLSMGVSALFTGSGAININSGVGARIFVTGAQSYIGPVNINNIAAIQFDGSSVTFDGFNGALPGSVNTITTPIINITNITIPGNLILGTFGSIGQTTGQIPNRLLVSGTSSIGGNIRTVDNQTYTGATTLTASPTLTSTAGSILFSNTINGGFGLTTSVINGQSATFSGAVGATTALTFLTTSAAGTTNINGGQVRTSTGAQNYNNPVLISADTTLGGAGTSGAININSSLNSVSATPLSLTLNTTAMTTLTGNIGNIFKLNNLSVTNNATLATPTLHTNGTQSFGGALTISGHSVLTSDAGSIVFGGSVLGSAAGFDLTLTSPNAINITPTFDTSNFFRNLVITNASNISSSAIQTTGTQTYGGAVLFQSLPAITFTGTTINFNNTVNSATTSTAITITGNLTVDPVNGSIGQEFASPGNVHIASISVSGTTHGPNTNTSGNQNWGAVVLTGNETFTSTAGSIAFGGALTGPFSAVVNAAGTASFVGVNVGALDVTAPGGINVNTTSIVTTIGDLSLRNFANLNVQFATTTLQSANNLLISGGSGSYLNLAANAANILTVRGGYSLTYSMPLSAGNYIDLGANINAGYAVSLNSPTRVTLPSTLNSTYAVNTINSTVDGPSSLNIYQATAQNGGATTISYPIGSTTPLSSLYIDQLIDIVNINTVVNVGSLGLQQYSNVNYSPGTAIFGSAAAITANTISINTKGGITLTGGMSANTTGTQSYVTNGGISLNGGDISLTGSSVTFNAATGMNSDAFGTPRSLTVNGNAVFSGAGIGNVNPLNILHVTGTTNISTGTIRTTSNQLYDGAVAMGASSSLTSDGGNITFGGAVNGGGGLTTSVTSPNLLTFAGSVGATTPLAFVTTNGTGDTRINGGSVRTSGAQNYNNHVFLGADTILSSTASGALNFTAIDNSATIPGPWGLTLTTGAMTTLSGNIGAVPATGILRFLTITGQSTINTASIDTTQAQTYTGAVTLGVPTINLNTNAAGTITFGNTINGASDLTVNASATGTTTFSNTVGATTALNSLSVTGAANVNTVTMRTSGNQTYNSAITQGANTTYTSTSGANLIKFVGSLVGNAAGRTLVVNSGATGSVEFDSTIGSGGTPFASLTLTGNTTYMAGVGPTVFVSGAELYNQALVLNNIPTLSLNGTSVTFNGAVTSTGAATSLTIPGNLVVASTGSIGLGVGAALNSLTVTGTTNVANNITTANNQLYNGLFTVSGTDTLTSNSGGITFNSGISVATNNAYDFTLIAALPVAIGGNWSTGNLLRNLIIGSGVVATQANISTSAISTTVGQTYFGPIVFQSLAAENFTAPTVTFNKTVNSATTSTAITITGNLVVSPSGSIGISSPVAVASLFVSGTTLGPNVTTAGNQTYTGALTLNTDETMTSTGGNITFGSTVNGDGVLGRNLTVNAAAGIVSFSGNVGPSVSLSSLNVSATTIQNNGISITTTGVQNYTGNMRILNGTNGAFNTTLGGDITFNGVIGNSDNATIFSGNQLVTNSSGQVIFNANVGIGPFGLAGVDLTAANGIVFNNVTVTTISAQTYHSPVILNGNVFFTTYIPSPVDFLSTVDSCAAGPGCLTPGSFSSIFNSINVSGISPSIINFAGAIGSNNPLSSFTFYNYNGPVTFGSTFDVAGPVSIIANGFYVNSSSLAPTITFNGAIGSITPPTNFDVVSAVAFAPYATSIVINSSLVATGAVTLTASSSATSSTVTFDGAIGTSLNPLGSLTVNAGSAINFNSGVSSPVYVAGAEVFNGPVLINSNPALQFNGTSVTFNAGLNSPGIASDVIIQNNLIMATGTSIGQTDALNSLIVNGSSSIGGDITTANGQHYYGPITLSQNAELTSPAGVIEIDQGVSGAAFNLTIDPTLVILAGTYNVASLNVTASSEIDFNNITVNTTAGQSYTAPEIVLQTGDSGLTDNSVNGIVFNGAVDNCGGALTCTGGAGPFSLNATELGASSTVFNASVGNINIINNLIISGQTTISGATVINTDNNQTYGGLVTMNNNLLLISQNGIVSFTLGTIGTDGIYGPVYDLSVYTYNSANGPTGAGITGTVYVNNFTMGGTGGGNVSPSVPDYSTVGGSTAVGAWNNTAIDPTATGMYCVNGFCISGTRVLNIDANNDSKTYGQTITPNPVADVAKITITGLAPGDTVTSIDLASAGYAPTATVAGSTYTITASNASGAGLTNHYTSIIYNNTAGQLTVNPAPLDILPDSIVKTYGTTTSATTTAFTPTGLQNGETVGQITLISAGLAPTANVAGSAYAVTGSAATGGTFDPTNYAINYLSGATITVNPAPLDITPISQTKVQGDFLPLSTTLFIVNGLQNGEIIGTVDAASAGLSLGATPGIYPFTSVSNANGGTFDINNYAINYIVAGNVTVTSNGDIVIPDVPPKEVIPVSNPSCVGPDCGNLEVMIDNLVETGVVSCGSMACPYGFVQATDSNGRVRILMPGDPVYLGDTIKKDKSSCVCVKSASTGKRMCMGAGQTKMEYNK